MEKLTKLDKDICKAISKNTVWNIWIVEQIFRRVKSYDRTLHILLHASMYNCEPNMVIDDPKRYPLKI